MPSWMLREAVTTATTKPGAGVVTLGATPTFVVTEFLGTSDSYAWKRHMVELGLADVTPIHGRKHGVVTFNKLKDKDWRAYQDTMVRSSVASHADWHYISGHHASHIYAGDIDPDYQHVLDEHDDCGFFNESYHDSTWSGFAPARDAVYMRASRKTGAGPLGPHDSPYRGTFPKAQGVIANACNTFRFRHTRMWLQETFPNAVIFGFWAKTPAGPQAVYPFVGSKTIQGYYQGDKTFWREPKKRFLTSYGVVDPLVVAADLRELNLVYAKSTKDHRHSLGMMIDGVCYRWVRSSLAKLSELELVEKGTIRAFPYAARGPL